MLSAIPSIVIALFPEQGINYRTVGNQTATAFCGHIRQNRLKLLQVSNFTADILQLIKGQIMNPGAGIGFIIDKGQQPPYLLQGEAKFPAPADKAKPPQVIFTI